MAEKRSLLKIRDDGLVHSGGLCAAPHAPRASWEFDEEQSVTNCHCRQTRVESHCSGRPFPRRKPCDSHVVHPLASCFAATLVSPLQHDSRSLHTTGLCFKCLRVGSSE